MQQPRREQDAPPPNTLGGECEELLTIFGALSDPTRLEMFEEIVERGEVGCVEFEHQFPLAKSTISYHAKLLHAAGLIETRRDGRFYLYRPSLEGIRERLPHFLERLRKAG